VLAALRGAKAIEHFEHAPTSFYLYHLAAVAECRLGYDEAAERLWQKSLKIAPGNGHARQNLDDARKPAGERNGPWSFPLNHWLSQQMVDDMQTELGKVTARDEEAHQQALERFLQKRPEVLHMLPVLLERGDPAGRQFAINLINTAKTPAMLEMLRAFALGQHGSDAQRTEAIRVLQQAGVLPNGAFRFWLKGEWQELMFLMNEISDEPVGSLPPEVQPLFEQAYELMVNKDDPDRAEAILKQALEIAPDQPTLLNNLAVAYVRQGRNQEADELTEQIFERFPDYFFGRINRANKLIRAGQFDEAAELLKGLLQRPKLHVSEYEALVTAYIELGLKSGQKETARQWYENLKRANPDSPMLRHWHHQFEPPSPGEIRKLLAQYLRQ
jgi:tetratricopeptide (TPR) repeat protein